MNWLTAKLLLEIWSIKDARIALKAKSLYNSRDTEALNLFFDIFEVV